jgi:hypothetical protein
VSLIPKRIFQESFFKKSTLTFFTYFGDVTIGNIERLFISLLSGFFVYYKALYRMVKTIDSTKHSTHPIERIEK